MSDEPRSMRVPDGWQLAIIRAGAADVVAMQLVDVVTESGRRGLGLIDWAPTPGRREILEGAGAVVEDEWAKRAARLEQGGC